ncbi:peptidase inhibitor family I36 protein [Streptomyces sp. NPDC091268]|uniref:peptidase inhibitor family I36 protein n=1 Tax=Streptomyces sp. NPDC091268 TaxID=3365979 RepID=UPI003801BEEE
MRTSSTVLAATVLAATALIPSTATAAHAAGHAPGHPAHRAPARAAGPPTLGACATGQLCLWAKADFKGTRHTHELSTLDINSCTALPAGTSAQSLANRTARPVTTYQSAECAETGEFQTYPGDGTWLPQSPYQVRAFKVWER